MKQSTLDKLIAAGGCLAVLIYLTFIAGVIALVFSGVRWLWLNS